MKLIISRALFSDFYKKNLAKKRATAAVANN